jgi:tetratricopeptide (TPR) repeat protein
MKYLTPVCLLAIFSGCGIASAPALSPNFSEQIADAERLLTGGPQSVADPDAALLITDKLLDKNPNSRAGRIIAAKANVALVAQGRDSIAESLLADAARHYEKALSLDSNDYASCMQLTEVYVQLGQFKDGRDSAHRAVQQSNVKGMENQCGTAMLAKANCGLRILVQAIRDNPKEDGEGYAQVVVATAQSVLSDYQAAKQFKPGDAYLQGSYVFAYMGRRSEELNELEQGIIQAPKHFPLHNRFRQVRSGRGEQAQAVAFYRALLRDDGPNASITYALAMAQSEAADKLRRDGDSEGAQRAYQAAVASFTAAMNAEPDWTDSCRHWLAVENLALARINQAAGSLAASKQYLKTAYGHSPKVLDKDENGLPAIRDNFGAYYGGTLNNIGTSLAASRTLEALQESLDFWLEFTQLHPKRLGWLYNNAAFTARDLGVGIEAGGKRGDNAAREKSATQAMALYEQSYALYEVAVELSPDSARIANDCALMLIYYLHRDYDLARKLFDRSVEVGKQTIADLPTDAPIEERHDAEETVGDAYQNIGKMARDQGKPFASYKSYLESAVQYFPYQRRESALWLRTKGVGRIRAVNAQGKPKKVDPRIAEYAKIHVEAQKLADAKDYDGALLLLDKVASKMVGLAAFHHDRGLYSFYYAKKAVAAGSSIGLIDGLFGDARSNLQKAVELDGERIEPRLHLAQTNYESGEFVNAAKISEALLSHISSRGGTTDALLAEAHKMRALSGNQVFVNAKMNKGDSPSELQAARNSFRALEKLDKIDLDLRKKWSVLERWAGNNTGALDIFERALAKAPNNQAILGAYVEGARATKQGTVAAKTLESRQDALGLWYLGMARYYSSFEVVNSDAATKLAQSITRLMRGIESFQASAKANSSYADSCRQWMAMCQAAQGYLTLDAKDYPTAQKFFLAAAATATDRITAAVYGTYTVKNGIEFIVDHYYRQQKDLPAAIKTLQAACVVITNDAGLSNNLGLFARDHGNQLVRRSKAAEAKPFFEISHDAYRNSVRLEPNSLRQRNDLCVVLLYNVKRDVEYAKKTLIACVAESGAALEDPEGDEQAIQDLNETVGDCYENLGYYYMTFGKDPAKARKNLEKSLTFWPFKRRRGVSFLRQLDSEPKK